jgi:UDP-N-acetylmuramoyl-L-alanyl-D-glutamate--2,6-diaminopimelate ligase
VTVGARLMRREITGLTCDSRQVEPGFLFAALPGERVDGRAYIAEALNRGAAAILAPPGTTTDLLNNAIPLITDDNPRRLYALMAARLHAGQPESVVAVTGTNGKTSVAAFTRQIWTRLGRRAASIGTLGVQAPGRSVSGGLTTPDPVDLHRDLQALSASGVQYLAMEASSHGLAQYRLDGVKLAAAAFTNLSRDHLDYHGSMATYLESKLRLFSDVLPEGAVAVVNADDPYAGVVMAACRSRGQRILSYGKRGNDVRLLHASPRATGQQLDIIVDGLEFSISLPLIGAFQVANALCALGLVLATGAETRMAVAALEELEGADGRLQFIVRRTNGASIYVDYAHTPDALLNMLEALRPHVAGHLAVVFGCGGDRDSGKRPEMGAVAAHLADRVYVTDDNPRSEDPAAIRRQILATCPDAAEIGDRAMAIRTAVAALDSKDLLVVAGKGHEAGQIVGEEVHPFLDADQVRVAVTEADA